MILRAFYRWRYHRRRRAGSFKYVRTRNERFGASFGAHMADASIQGRGTSGRYDLHRQRRRRWIKYGLILLGLILLIAFIRESIRGLALFMN